MDEYTETLKLTYKTKEIPAGNHLKQHRTTMTKN